MNLYIKCTAKPYSFLVFDATLTSHNPSRIRKNLSEIISKLIMTIDNYIRDEILHINREAAKTSALSYGKISKYKYLAGEEILPSNRRKIIEQAKFAYSSLEKPLEKQTEQRVVDLKSLKPISYIINQNIEKFIFLVNILYLLFFKRYT